MHQTSEVRLAAQDSREQSRSPLYRVYWTAFVLSVGFLCFLGGFLITLLRVFPFDVLRDSFIGLGALRESMASKSQYDSDRYAHISSAAALGVTRYDAARAYNGYTVFTSASAQSAYLIDMRGEIVHEWHLPYAQVWNRSSAIRNPAPPSALYWRRASLFPNGDLLAVYEVQDRSPYGYGLVKMDRDSKPIWTYLDHVHHDVTVGDDGRIYTLSHRIRTEPMPELPNILAPSMEDFIVELSPDGKLLKKLSLYDALAHSRFSGVTNILRNSIKGDTLHANEVNPLPPEFRRIFPFATDNTVLVSSRNLDALMLVDLDSEKVTWMLRGPWARQHDPEPLPNGDILLFDNVGDLARGGRSRVLELEPNPLKIVWEFPGDSGEDLNSSIRSTVQKLPNGNVLITESDNARILEVTQDKQVVWEYRNPFREGDHRQYVGVLEGAHRFAPDQLAFTFNRITKLAQKDPGEEKRNVR